MGRRERRREWMVEGGVMRCTDRNERMKSQRSGLALVYVCFQGEGIVPRLIEHSLRILLILFQHGFFSSLASFTSLISKSKSLSMHVCVHVCLRLNYKLMRISLSKRLVIDSAVIGQWQEMVGEMEHKHASDTIYRINGRQLVYTHECVHVCVGEGG